MSILTNLSQLCANFVQSEQLCPCCANSNQSEPILTNLNQLCASSGQSKQILRHYVPKKPLFIQFWPTLSHAVPILTNLSQISAALCQFWLICVNFVPLCGNFGQSETITHNLWQLQVTLCQFWPICANSVPLLANCGQSEPTLSHSVPLHAFLSKVGDLPENVCGNPYFYITPTPF